LGRALVDEELQESDALAHLSPAHLAVATQLRSRQIVLCLAYLRGVVPGTDLRTAGAFMDELLERRPV
jgi:hypothetical protein